MSRCTQQSHAAAKMLHVIAPDLSELRSKGRNECGEWVDCVLCSSTLLIEPVVTVERPASVEVTL